VRVLESTYLRQGGVSDTPVKQQQGEEVER